MSGLIGIQPSTGDGKLWTRMEERWEAANSTIYPGTGGQLMVGYFLHIFVLSHSIINNRVHKIENSDL